MGFSDPSNEAPTGETPEVGPEESGAPVRVLVIDDNPSIHDDLRKTLVAESPLVSTLDEMEQALSDLPPESSPVSVPEMELLSAYQGCDGVEVLKQEHEEARNVDVAIVDMRMPPGWDGIETVQRLWAVEPTLHVIICSAYADYTWQDMSRQLGTSDQLLVLRKPFEPIEMIQAVVSAARKRASQREALRLLGDLSEERGRLQTLVSGLSALNHDAALLPEEEALACILDQCIATSRARGGALVEWRGEAAVLIERDLPRLPLGWDRGLGERLERGQTDTENRRLWTVPVSERHAVVLSGPSASDRTYLRVLMEHARALLVAVRARAALASANAELEARVQERTEVLERTNQELHSALADLQTKNQRLQELGVRDALTGLLSHAYFQRRLDEELARSRRHGRIFSLIFVDIDHFRSVNERLGFSVGDQLLKVVARLIHGSSRTSDQSFRIPKGAGESAARYAGDQFVLMLPETDREGALAKARKLKERSEQTCQSMGAARVTLSMGVATYPDDAVEREQLLEAAETALNAAKGGGRNQIVPYSIELVDGTTAAEAGRLRRAKAFDRIVEEERFHFVFQPIMDAETHAPYAYEALCRIDDEDFGHILEALEYAGAHGQLIRLGRRLRASLLQKIDELPEGCYLFLNMHPGELRDEQLGGPDTPLYLARERVVVELTESVPLETNPVLMAALDRLRRQGIRVALDDVGAGYAGLRTLAKIRPDYVKLDMALIHGIRRESTSAHLVRHLVDFCAGEDIMLVAEGIENAEECQVVRELGCRLMQGYFFARPGEDFPAVDGSKLGCD